MTTLADRYAAAKRVFDEAEAALKILKDEINKLGQPTLEGQFCTVTLGLSERNTLDAALVKKYLTTAQIVECTKTSLVSTVRVKAKVELAA